jgi:hypothetical protein
MKTLALVAVACCALATPALADHINVNVKLTNVSMVSQGGDGRGQANVALVAQGAIATVQAPRHDPTVVINTGYIPVGSP